MQEKVILVAVPVVFKKTQDKVDWFVVKQGGEAEWEIPKTAVRRGESSVRAAIRAMAEQGGMRAKVLEEVGRSGGATKVNGKPVTKRLLYYLMQYKDGGEVLGYEAFEWLEFSKALKKLTLKKDLEMLKEAKVIYKDIEKKKNGRLDDDPEIEEELLEEPFRQEE